MKKLIISIAVISFTLTAGIIVTAEEKKEGSKIDAAYVIDKCSSCHKIDKTCAKIGQKDEAKWTKTINKMAEKMAGKGVKLNDKEQNGLAKYLSSLSKDKNDLCK